MILYYLPLQALCFHRGYLALLLNCRICSYEPSHLGQLILLSVARLGRRWLLAITVLISLALSYLLYSCKEPLLSITPRYLCTMVSRTAPVNYNAVPPITNSISTSLASHPMASIHSTFTLSRREMVSHTSLQYPIPPRMINFGLGLSGTAFGTY